MNKTILSLLAILLVGVSVASASLWSIGVSEVQVTKGHDSEWRSVPRTLWYGQDFINNLAVDKTYKFSEVPPSRDHYGKQTSSGGQVYYTFANGMTRQGYFNALDIESTLTPNPPKPKVITQEFSVWPTGKTFKNDIPGYYTGKDIGTPEPYLFSEPPIKVQDDSDNKIVMLPLGGGSGGPVQVTTN